jgi:hypothetical protein
VVSSCARKIYKGTAPPRLGLVRTNTLAVGLGLPAAQPHAKSIHEGSLGQTSPIDLDLSD